MMKLKPIFPYIAVLNQKRECDRGFSDPLTCAEAAVCLGRLAMTGNDMPENTATSSNSLSIPRTLLSLKFEPALTGSQEML